MITATHTPLLTKAIEGSIVIGGDLIVCDPYFAHETENPIRDILAGRWIGQTAFYQEAIDCLSHDTSYFSKLIAVEAINRNLNRDTAKAIFDRYGSPAHFFTLYSDAVQVIEAEIENGNVYTQLVDELTAGYTPPKGQYIESFKFHVLCGVVKSLKESFVSLEVVQEELKTATKVRNNPLYAKVQYLHLKHEDAYQYTPHDARRWERVSCYETSSGKIAIFNEDWYKQNNQENDSTAIDAQNLCVAEEEGSFLNIKKIGMSDIGLATVTPLREQSDPVFAVFQEGKIVELLIHFDEDLGLDD